MIKLLQTKKSQIGFTFVSKRSRSQQRGFTSSEKESPKGFTLIELLIVITIIVIIIAIAAVSFTTVQRNARDSQRKSDLKKVQLALEEFFADNGAYPDEPPNDHMSCSTVVNSLDGAWNVLGVYGRNHMTSTVKRHWADDSFTCNGITYMTKLPGDPITIDCWDHLPTEAACGTHMNGYIYEVRQTCPASGIADVEGNTCTPNAGWCNYKYGGNCKKYALFARLENPSDPERWVSGRDSTCDEIAVTGDASMDRSWKDPTNNTPYYCVHSP